MNELIYNPLFGIALSLGIYRFSRWLNKKTNSPLCNALLLSIVFIIIILRLFNIPLDAYNNGSTIISMLLTPATCVLAYSIYHQRKQLKRYLIPILFGCLTGSITSISSIYLLCSLFGLSKELTYSLLPKSVTTAIAIEVSEQLNGIPSITVAVVVVTGILGSIFCPMLIKLLHLKNPIANGVAIGTCSHAVGTSKALELGEMEGAMSGIAIGISGMITVLLALLFI